MKHLLAILFLLPFLSIAQEDPESTPIVDIDKGIKLVWDAGLGWEGHNIINHRISIGTESGVYTDGRLIDRRIPTAAEPVVVMVETPGTYYIAVTALNDLGLESAPSNEVKVTVRSISTPNAPVIRLGEQFEVLAVTETVTTTRIIKEVKP
jgi:hypothetical protein